jgi:phosphoglucomutase
MDAAKEYRRWLEHPGHSEQDARELQMLASRPEEIEERFGRELEFGTGGMRGILGAGLNRMNVPMVRRVSHALAKYVQENGGHLIVIGYDCRRMSRRFAEEAALAMAAVGIRASVSPVLCPTPELSFAVRHLKAGAGVMITASHNPPEYNGYKVYGADGGQMLPEAVRAVSRYLPALEDIFSIPTLGAKEAEDSNMVVATAPEVRTAYLEAVLREAKMGVVQPADRQQLEVLYTPLHGTGAVPVREVLQLAGYTRASVFGPQAEADADFSTVESPNPEEAEALSMAMEAAATAGVDVVLGTDPDADRVGIAVLEAPMQYRLLSGNQVGALLVDFVLRARQSAGTMPNDGVVFKTIVTSDLGARIAKRHGVRVEDTLTGFKYIGARIRECEESGTGTFLFGYEESYGYLLSDIVRDKDAVQSVLAICEMAACYKAEGKSLLTALDALQREYGYSAERMLNVTLPGEDGIRRMQRCMASLRTEAVEVPGISLARFEDYLSQEAKNYGEGGSEVGSEPLTLPKADVLKWIYEDESWIAIRPSGTEPKLKVYVSARATSEPQADSKAERMRRAIETRIQ